MQRRGFIGGFLGTGLQAVLTRVAGVRQSTDLTLGTSTVAPAKLDHLELITDSYARAYLTRPPVELLMQITGTLAEVQNLAATRQPLDTQRRLWYLTGALAGLTGMVLINLGAEAHAEARATFGTARTAAEGHGDRKLRAWLLTQEAVIDLYYGDPGAVIDLAEQARLLAGSSPSSASAWAHALLARAHARRGEHRDALSALHRCEAIVAALDPYPAERAESALGYTPRQAHFHAGNVLTTVGDLGAALPHQRAALNLYPADNYMDRTLVHHDQARGLVAAGRPEEGCALLAETIADIPVDYRVDLVKAPARDILASIGNQHRKLPEARGLRDLLAIGPAR